MRVMPECARANIRGPKTRKVALRGLWRSDCCPGADDGDWSRAWRTRLFRPQHQLQLSFVSLAYPIAPLHLLSDGTPFQPRRGARSSMPTGRVKQHVISDISREIVYILLISRLVLLFRSKKFYLRERPCAVLAGPPPRPAAQGRRGPLLWRKSKTAMSFMTANVTLAGA